LKDRVDRTAKDNAWITLPKSGSAGESLHFSQVAAGLAEVAFGTLTSSCSMRDKTQSYSLPVTFTAQYSQFPVMLILSGAAAVRALPLALVGLLLGAADERPALGSRSAARSGCPT
jgi:hypothetical protein